MVDSERSRHSFSTLGLSLLLLGTLLHTVSAFTGPNLPRAPITSQKALPHPSAFHTDDEWHPRDPAHTTPQLLAGIWYQIAQGATMSKGETLTVVYPDMQGEFTPAYLARLFHHLDVCKDVCDHFGITTTLVPYTEKGKITGFTAKSFRNPEQKDEFEFDYDPFWDDGTDFDNLYTGVDDEDLPGDPYPEIVDKVPDDDEVLVNITQAWVGKLMADMGVCPFTNSATKAGLPQGEVFYCVDRSTSPEDMYSKYWQEVVRVEQNPERDLSTTLLIAPEFLLDNVELYESFCNTLTQPLVPLQIEDLVQLVFFHPHWSFRDGDARASNAANYARRSPWPMINILRTKQVRAAQKGIPTGLVYKQNEKTLNSVGVQKLETMLRLRDWSPIADLQVNRKETDALKIAEDMKSGKVQEKDLLLAHDATPAANRVAEKEVEGANLVKVISQALEKRLGKNGPVEPLSGPETSATSMAVDYLVEELDRWAVQKSSSQSTVVEEVAMPTEGEPAAAVEETQAEAPVEETASEESEVPAEIAAKRAAQMEAARKALMSDFGGEDDEQVSDDVIFGRTNIPDRPPEDVDFQEGMNPDSFY